MCNDVNHGYQTWQPAAYNYNHSYVPCVFFDGKSIEIKHQKESLEEVSDAITKTYPNVKKDDLEDNEGSKESDNIGCPPAGYVGRNLLLIRG